MKRAAANPPAAKIGIGATDCSTAHLRRVAIAVLLDRSSFQTTSTSPARNTRTQLSSPGAVGADACGLQRDALQVQRLGAIRC